jgi:hypothetical protein
MKNTFSNEMKEAINHKLNEIKIKKNVGGYQITGKGGVENSIIFMFVKKPNFINRLFCRLCLGWVWIDKS